MAHGRALMPRHRPPGAGAEADVGQPRLLIVVDMQGQVGAWSRIDIIVADPRQQPIDAVAEPFQHGAEQQPMFVAVTTAPTGDQLGLEAVDVESDTATEDQVKVLERDGVDVSPVQRGKRRPGGIQAPSVPSPCQVGIEVESIDLPLIGGSVLLPVFVRNEPVRPEA